MLNISFIISNNHKIKIPHLYAVREPVGGIYILTNKLELSALYIGLVSLMATVVVSVVYVEHRKKRQSQPLLHCMHGMTKLRRLERYYMFYLYVKRPREIFTIQPEFLREITKAWDKATLKTST